MTLPDLLQRIISLWGWRKKLKHLTDCRFDRIWEGGELASFEVFLLNKAVPAGGFLIKFPITKTNVWLFYKIAGVKDNAVVLSGHPEVAVPQYLYRYDCPEEWRQYPVWEFSL